jgi:opacity protein-like surface antigen
MKQLLAAAAIATAFAAPAQAAEWTYCTDSQETASINLLLGDTDVIGIETIDMESGDKKWSTKAGQGVTTIAVGQGFDTDDRMLVDVTDEKGAGIIAQLRVFKAYEGEDYVFGGTLRIAGVGAWAVECSGP